MSGFIQSIETSLPPFVTKQIHIADFMVKYFRLNAEEEKALRVLYRASGIQERYSVIGDFGENPNGRGFFLSEAGLPTAKPRMELYRKHAIGLASRAAGDAMFKQKIQPEEVTHLITISCTGMYAPGLDIELVEALELQTSVKRTAINFMGCYASFNGLKMADQIVRSDPQAKVLMVSVELCSIHLQKKKDEENLLANCIFGDGAAAVLITSVPCRGSLQLKDFYSDLALGGKPEMSWLIGDHGFEMKLSRKIPGIIKDGIQQLTDRLLKKTRLSVPDVDFFAIHPGGRRILEVIEEKLGITKEDNRYAREVLKAHGNMSSPTVLFVMKRIMDGLTQKDHGKHLLSFAFGPGLTLESALLKVTWHA